jgi:hypothetical protein
LIGATRASGTNQKAPDLRIYAQDWSTLGQF